jgi:hypothetical protein
METVTASPHDGSGWRLNSDRSSLLRRRALRRLSRERHAIYSTLDEQVLAEIPDAARHQVRDRAWTRLRSKFPDRYLELFALEQGGIDEMPPDIRTKSWQRATSRVADLCRTAYRSRYAESRAEGMTPAKAYDRAIADVRIGNADLFTRLPAEEYLLWLAVPESPAPAGAIRIHGWPRPRGGHEGTSLGARRGTAQTAHRTGAQ